MKNKEQINTNIAGISVVATGIYGTVIGVLLLLKIIPPIIVIVISIIVVIVGFFMNVDNKK